MPIMHQRGLMKMKAIEKLPHTNSHTQSFLSCVGCLLSPRGVRQAASSQPVRAMSDGASQRQLDEELWCLASGNFPDGWQDEKTDKAAIARIVELHKKGANVNWVHPTMPEGRAYQFTPLHIAADRGKDEIVKCLVNDCKAGMFEPQHPPTYACTLSCPPVCSATSDNRAALAMDVCARCADINKRQAQYGETPLQHIDGRTGNGREQIYSFLKMKTAMQAALAAQKFKTAGKQKNKDAVQQITDGTAA